MILTDFTGAVFNSDALITTPPDLSNFWYPDFYVTFQIPGFTDYSPVVDGVIQSLTLVNAVAEPGTGALMAAAMLLLVAFKRRSAGDSLIPKGRAGRRAIWRTS
jgi:hypothetical protein